MKKSYNNNELKISAPTRNEELQLLDGSYSVLNIQDQFKNIFKNSILRLEEDIILNF